MTGTALIIGHSGQDGSYLSELLLAKKYRVVGVSRGDAFDSAAPSLARPLDVADGESLRQLLDDVAPDEIFYLAAHHHSAEMDQGDVGSLVRASFQVHVDGLMTVLDQIRRELTSARLFYAASSHVFGNPPESPQSESTPLRPDAPYAISKVAGIHLCRYYRAEYGVFASCGYLYNHESPRRGPQFLSRKIVAGAVAISQRQANELRLGDLSAIVDWGLASDYVDAMWRILQLDTPEDFIIASGREHSVADFVAAVFARLDLDWREYVVEDPSIIQKPRARLPLVGDFARLRRATGWQPRHGLDAIAQIMVDDELARSTNA